MHRITPRNVGLGIAVYAIGVAAGSQFLGKQESDEQDDTSCCKFEGLASTYDKEIDSSEWMSGILGYRKRLLRHCR